MRVVVAPDCFGGTLSAGAAARAIASGWSAARPDDDVEMCPLADGGPGFLTALAQPDRILHRISVTGPEHHQVQTSFLTGTQDAVPTAWVESALVIGPQLLMPTPAPLPERSTTGLGQLLAHLKSLGIRRIVIGLGGSATNDAGAGLLAALAEAAGLITKADVPSTPDVYSLLTSGGGTLTRLSSSDLIWLPQLREYWSDVDLVIARDVDCPLLGADGASHGFGPQKGGTPAQIAQLETSLAHFAAVVEQKATDIPVQSFPHTPGAGAAGGTAFALLHLGARQIPGAQVVAEATDLAGRLATADMVITGEGRLDWQSLRGKVIAEVAATAHTLQIPVLVIAGQVDLPPAEQSKIGHVFAVTDIAAPAQSLTDPTHWLTLRTNQIATDLKEATKSF